MHFDWIRSLQAYLKLDGSRPMEGSLDLYESGVASHPILWYDVSLRRTAADSLDIMDRAGENYRDLNLRSLYTTAAGAINTNTITALSGVGVVVGGVQLYGGKIYFPTDTMIEEPEGGWLNIRNHADDAYKSLRIAQLSMELITSYDASSEWRAADEGEVNLRVYDGDAWQDVARWGTENSRDIAFHIMKGGNITALAESALDWRLGYFAPHRASQADQPTPAAWEMMIWRDTDDDKVYLMYNDPDVGVKKVEMT